LAKVKDLKLNEEQASGGVALGETSTTAYRGDRGKTAYDHSQVTHAPSNAQKNSDITKAEIEAKLTGGITSHTHNLFAETVVLASQYTVTADDTWETLITSGTTPTMDVQVSAQITFYSASAKQFLVRIIDSNTGVLGIAEFDYKTAEVPVTYTLNGYGSVDAYTISLQVYAKTDDKVYADLDSVTKATVMNIISTVTQ